jgi:hypothetical protein
VKRTYRIDLIESLPTDERDEDGRPVMVEVEVEGGLEAAMQEAATMVHALHRLGGCLVIVPEREQVGAIGDEDAFRTRGFMFRWEKSSPVRRAKLEPLNDREPIEQAPELVRVEASE